MKYEPDIDRVRLISISGVCDYKCNICPLMMMCHAYANKDVKKGVIATQWLIGKNK